ncbi:hypothetical protein KAW65_04765 [candidate division WOR-3 bacterium]|nr:hypothetical protein [candidate division WOR-3 bacterium]
MIFGLLILILCVTFLIRIAPWYHEPVFEVDTWEHLLAIKTIRERKKIPNTIPYYLTGNTFYYPPLLYILLSVFSQQFIEKYRYYFSPLTDAVISAISAGLMYCFTNSISLSLFTALIYTTSPILLPTTSSLTPRPLGALFVQLFFVSTLLFLKTNCPVFFFIMLLLACLTALSHRMASQIIFLIAISLSIFYKNITPLLTVSISELLFFIFLPSLYLRVRIGHLQNLLVWHRYFKKNYNLTGKVKGIIEAGIFYPFVLVTTFLITKMPPASPTSQGGFEFAFFENISLSLIVIIFIVLFITPSLGEPERYFSYGALPISLLGAYCLTTDFKWIIAIGLLFQVCFYIHKHIIISHSKKKPYWWTPSFVKLIEKLKQYPRESRFLCLPYPMNRPIAYMGEVKTLHFTPEAFLLLTKMFLKGEGLITDDDFTSGKIPLQEIFIRLKIEYLLVKKGYIDINPSYWKIIDTIGDYEIYRFYIST